MTPEHVSRRMIEDMTIRQFGPKTQHDYVRVVADFARFLGRSPDQAGPEDLRRYQLHLAAERASPAKMNAAVSALRFFFKVTLARPGFGERLATVRKEDRLPQVLSPEEVALLLHPQQELQLGSVPKADIRCAGLAAIVEPARPAPATIASRMRVITPNARITARTMWKTFMRRSQRLAEGRRATSERGSGYQRRSDGNLIMTRILMVRHGHVEGIEPPRFRGRCELPLTELGQRQAAATAARIAASAKVAAVWTSPVQRCVATGRAIAEATGAPARVVEALNDLDYGDWTWLTYEAARAADQDIYDRWYSAPASVRFPGGESLQDLVLRAGDALRLAVAEGVGDGRVLVLVTHDSLGRAVLMQALDQPLSAYRRLVMSPCGITEIDATGAHTQVLGVNATEHLAGV